MDATQEVQKAAEEEEPPEDHARMRQQEACSRKPESRASFKALLLVRVSGVDL
jgi:hypothetical protein